MGFMEELESLGVNVKEGMDRVMGDESLYEMMLGMFVDEVHSNRVQIEDFKNGTDYKELTERIHTLKGTAGNLSLTPLFARYTEVLKLLREKKPQEAEAVFVQIGPVQDEIIACIRRNQN